MADPTPEAPRIPASYGVPTDASGAELLPWTWARERLEAGRNYWACTTRPDGRPHSMPVWGLWLNGRFMFSTGPTSQKARNLARNPSVVVHLESGDEAIILEGEARHERDGEARALFAEAYEAKYGINVDFEDENFPVFAVEPSVAHVWSEQNYPKTATRWVF